MLNHARGAAERTARALSSTVDRSSSWIEQLEPTSRRGTVVGWFRLYRGADGPLYAMLFSAYVFITVIPATLVISTYVYRDPSRLADRLTGRLALGSSTSTLLHGVLVGAASHRLLSTVIAVANVVVFGTGYGRLLQLAIRTSRNRPGADQRLPMANLLGEHRGRFAALRAARA